MIKGTTKRASRAAFVVLALGCGGRTGIQASDGGGSSSGASSGVIENGPPPTGGQGGSGDTAGTGSGTAGAASGGTAGVGGSAGSSCTGVTCTTRPASLCKNTATARIYSAIGTCSGAGVCSYTPTDTGCGTNEACAGAGVCSVCKADSSCGASCTACGTGTPKCKDLGTTSRCVGCLSDADCSAATPICDASTNVCGTPPSCAGLAATCGPNSNASCCASSVVPGGTFNRSNDANYPATVGDFRLDTYEITVGRFRKFWSAYPGDMPYATGKNPNNPSDPGWDASWNTSELPASQAGLTANISCNSIYQTWTAGNDTLPMNCLDWYEAEAFCIWDGGRLPTEAEWNYAAAGGTAQRAYPWGDAAPDWTFANFCNSGYCVAPPSGSVNRVGSESPKGDGLYGQADLAGNVWEWVQDTYSYTSPYTTPCNNCTSTMDYTRVLRGGSFYNNASYLISTYRSYDAPSDHNYGGGGRCARPR